MDPIGFSLENFDLIGQIADDGWRRPDRRYQANWSTGPKLNGAGQPAPGAAFSRSDVFVRTLTEKLLTYGTGRALKYYDMPVVRRSRATPRRTTTGFRR